ncbi:PadR family transcriptional regulator [Kineosporiaceae bacterium B12]|nr:PadR family transcriptional regulator [Kineococcus rubinsiae]
MRGMFEGPGRGRGRHHFAEAMAAAGGPGGRRGPGGPGGFGPGGPVFGDFGMGGFGRGFGRGGFGPGGFGPGRGGRRGRGDVRAAVLALLAEGPSNGYRIIGEVAQRSGGAWRPSPGSVYPTLQQLQDEGLVETDPADAKQFALTEQGRAYVEEHLAGKPAPWEAPEFRVEEGEQSLHTQVRQIALTLQQVVLAGRPGDLQRVSDVLERCRRELVAILGEDLRPGSGD